MYSVTVLPKVQKSINGLERNVANRVLSALLGLASDPRPPGCIKIKSEDGVWRIRVGDYRVGYSIDDLNQVVTVIRIGHRSDFYN